MNLSIFTFFILIVRTKININCLIKASEKVEDRKSSALHHYKVVKKSTQYLATYNFQLLILLFRHHKHKRILPDLKQSIVLMCLRINISLGI